LFELAAKLAIREAFVLFFYTRRRLRGLQPLWGIGLLQKTTGTAYYLHDGRARSIEEAILWHGGEAQKSRDAFAQLTQQQRMQLIKFLNSL